MLLCECFREKLKSDYSFLDSGKDIPMLVSASFDGTIKIWDLETYQEIRTLDCRDPYVGSIAVSDDKKHIYGGGNIVTLWCFHTGKLISCFEGHTNEIRWVHIIQQQPSLV